MNTEQPKIEWAGYWVMVILLIPLLAWLGNQWEAGPDGQLHPVHIGLLTLGLGMPVALAIMQFRYYAKQGDRHWFLSSPLLLLACAILWPLWPFAVMIAGIFFFADECKNWSKGGRFMEKNVVGPIRRFQCPHCDITHTGNCPRCGWAPPDMPNNTPDAWVGTTKVPSHTQPHPRNSSCGKCGGAVMSGGRCSRCW